MGVFGADYSKQKASKGGVYFRPGTYKVELEKVAIINTRASGQQFCVTGKILEAEGPEATQVGATASTMVKVGHDMFPSTTKQFLQAAYSESLGKAFAEEEIDEEMAEMSVTEANPLGGTVLNLVAVNIKTKAGNDFTKLVWSPVNVKLPQ